MPRELAENFTLMLAPFAPHLAEEMWHRLGHERTLARRPWPSYDPAKLVEEHDGTACAGKRQAVRQDHRRRRAHQTILQTAASSPGVQQWITGKTVKKQIYVPMKLVNLVVG